MKRIADLSINDKVFVVFANEIKEFNIGYINKEEISFEQGYYSKMKICNESHTTFFYSTYSNDKGCTLSAFTSKKDALHHLKLGCLDKINVMKSNILEHLQKLKDYRLEHFDVLSGFDIQDLENEIKQTI
jgi:hypothetical protein